MSLQLREVILFELKPRKRGSEVGGLDEQKMQRSDSEASGKKNALKKDRAGKRCVSCTSSREVERERRKGRRRKSRTQ